MKDVPPARRGSQQKAWLRESDTILTFTYWRVGEKFKKKKKKKELKHSNNATSRHCDRRNRKDSLEGYYTDWLYWLDLIRRNAIKSKYLEYFSKQDEIVDRRVKSNPNLIISRGHAWIIWWLWSAVRCWQKHKDVLGPVKSTLDEINSTSRKSIRKVS